ncbi:MAG TPA: FG-GAP repeat protein, partial [Terracidiphilus sp.]
MFARTEDTWSEQAELAPSDAVSQENFGGSVALSRNIAAVGASSYLQAGAAYVFVQAGGTWSQRAKITPSDANASN